ncbi:MAG: RHS repeat domain-containing protein, partial [Actinomycetota bacterium]
MSNTYESRDGLFSIVIQNLDESFTMRDPDGGIRNFHSFDGSNLEGTLMSEEDRNGRRTTFLYDHQGLLATIVDSLGRSIMIQYSPQGRIIAVTDSLGRIWFLTYDADGNLIRVEAPAVMGVGNGFSGTPTTTYTYSGGTGDPRLDHNLIAVIRPDEDGTGMAALQNTYSIGDRVIAQTFGGTNASGVPAGGTVTFAYFAFNPGADPLDPNLPRRAALVTRPNGAQINVLANYMGNPLQRTYFTNLDLRPGEPNYITQYAHDLDGNLLGVLRPDGNALSITYDSLGQRHEQGNPIEIRWIADPVASGGRGDGRGAEAADRVVSITYEPLFNQVASITEERGNDPLYVPQNGGFWYPERYTTTITYDWQEDPIASGAAAEAARFGILLDGVPMNLGDVNGDGTVVQGSGNLIRIDRPAVLLDPTSHQAGIEGDTLQEIVTLIAYNQFGQATSRIDAEGNRDEYEYHPEEDPDGDGTPTPPPPDGRILDASTGGYLKAWTRDVAFSPGRNNGTDPTPVSIRHDHLYDEAGDLTDSI